MRSLFSLAVLVSDVSSFFKVMEQLDGNLCLMWGAFMASVLILLVTHQTPIFFRKNHNDMLAMDSVEFMKGEHSFDADGFIS